MRLLLFALACAALVTYVPSVDGSRALSQATAGAPAPMMEPDYSRAGCDNFTQDQWQPLRPGYHITAPYGWTNDPHGMFQDPNTGRHHVFIQYNPKAIKWGAPFWAHVASDDMVHWTWLPPALQPTAPYDFNGCWSGAATVTVENVPTLTYTAAGTDIPELGNKFQRQAAAVPADLSDPWLKEWVKPDTNPFLAQVPPGGINTQFRDPTEGRHGAWLALTSPNNPYRLPDSSYAIVIGGQAYCMGNAGIYISSNLTGPWRYVGNFANQMTFEPEIDGQCMAGGPAAPTSYSGPSYGGPCDQFGAACRAWEVVDILELSPGIFMFKWDDQSRYRPNFNQEWYTLSNAPFNYKALVPPTDAGVVAMDGNTEETLGEQYSTYGLATAAANETTYNIMTAYNYANASDESAEQTLYQPFLNNKRFYPQAMDYGSIYASMIYRTNDSRQIIHSWVYETAAGCRESCSDQFPDLINITNFKGVLALPRELTYDNDTETARLYPVSEVELLRTDQLFTGSSSSLPEVLVEESTVTPGANNTARQMELELMFELVPGELAAAGTNTSGSPFKVGARVLTGNNTYVDCFINGTVVPVPPNAEGSDGATAAIGSMFVFVDRSNAGGYSNTTYMEGGPVPLPVNGYLLLPEHKIELSVFVDHTIWEVYAEGGLGRIISRVYPSDDTAAWGVEAFGDLQGGNVTMAGDVWAMENAWLGTNC